jgi:hypothetical protein
MVDKRIGMNRCDGRLLQLKAEEFIMINISNEHTYGNLPPEVLLVVILGVPTV